MTDEKLNECCASTHGIYIKGIMCLMHKSENYGKILLKQKYKQTENTCKNFARQLVKHLPYSENEIEEAIAELIREHVCYFEDDFLCQKRMVRDNEISEARAEAGKKGGKNSSFAKANIKANNKAKEKANTEYEYEYENIDGFDEKESLREKTIAELKAVFDIFRISYPGTKRGLEVEFDNFKKKHKDWMEVVSQLSNSLSYQKSSREIVKQAGGFVPEWKNLTTWLNQRCWTEEINIDNLSNNGRNTKRSSKGATDLEIANALSRGFSANS